MRRLLVIVAVVGIAALLFAAPLLDMRVGNDAADTGSPPLRGRLVWTARDGLWLRDFHDGSERNIVATSTAVGGSITSVTFAPDGRRIAWSQQATGGGATGADIWVADANGGGAQVLASRDAPTTMLEAPIWQRGDTLYYVARRFPAGREETRVERLQSGGRPQQIASGLHMVSLTPDESALVYATRQRDAGQALLVQVLGASSPPCVLAVDEPFPGVEQPRVSPDGTRVAFTASAPATARDGACSRASSTSVGQSWRSALQQALAPAVAWAHGAPADIWIINMDGSGLRRVAELKDDEPTLAWSPDGEYLVVLGPKGLHVVSARGGQLMTLKAPADYGWVAWGEPVAQ